MHPAELPPDLLLKECRFETTRRQGPGGQHRNKVETAVIVKHLPTGVSAEANEKRSQDANRRESIFRLRVALAVQIRIERGPEPSLLLGQRTTSGRFSINPGHQEFPSLLAEVMDRLEKNNYSIPETADEIGVSGSQVLKFLKLCPPAFERFNRERIARDLPRIKF